MPKKKIKSKIDQVKAKGQKALGKVKRSSLPVITSIAQAGKNTRQRKWLLWGLEFVAGIIVAFAVLTGALLWRLSYGEISLDFIATPIENSINGELEGYSLAVGGAVLEQSNGDAGISFRLRDLVLRDGSGTMIAEAPRAAIGVSPLSLLVGNITPTSIDLIGPELIAIIRDDGRFELDIESSIEANNTATTSQSGVTDDTAVTDDVDAGAQDQKPVAHFKTLFGLGPSADDDGFLGSVERIGIQSADIIFIHERLGIRWEIHQGTLEIARSGDEINFVAEAKAPDQPDQAPFKVSGMLTDHGAGIKVFAELADFVPRRAAALIDGLGGLALLDMPITAQSEIILSDSGKVLSFDMAAGLDPGTLRFGEDTENGFSIEKSLISLSFDAESNRAEISPSTIRFTDGEVTLNGSLIPPRIGADDNSEDRFWEVSLKGTDGKFATEGLGDPLVIRDANLQLRYDPFNGQIWIDQARLISTGTTMAIAGRIVPGERSPSVEMTVNFSPMSVTAFKQTWPTPLAPGARTWFFDNILGGTITDLSILLDFPAGLIADIEDWKPIPSQAFDMAFGFTGVTARYYSALPALHQATGRAKMKGGHFTVEVIDGIISVDSGGTIENVSGSVEIPNVTGDPAIAYLRTVAASKTSALLELVNYEPLGYANDVGLVPAETGGHSRVELDLSIPLVNDVTIRDINAAARADIHEFSVVDLFDDQDVEQGELILRVLPTRMEAAGEMQLAGVATHLNWRRQFGVEGGGNLALRMRLDDAERERLGLELDFLKGPVEVEIVPDQLGTSGSNLSILADLTDAVLSYPALGWEKRAGVAGDAQFRLIRNNDGTRELKDFVLVSQGTKITGDVTITQDAEILAADFSEFQLSEGDRLSLAARRNSDGSLDVKIRGQSLDASGIIQGMFTDGDAPSIAAENDTINVDAVIARVRGNSNAVLTDVNANLVQSGGVTRRMSVNALAGGQPMAIGIDPAEGHRRALKISSSDAGETLRFAGLYSRVDGGTMDLRATLPNRPDRATQGQLSVVNFRLQDERIVNRIVSVAPTEFEQSQRQQQQQQAAQGDFFTRLSMPFSRQSGVLTIGESFVRGPTVGATLRGTVDFNRNAIDLTGTYVPAYALNNFLSDVPVIGQILTGGRNEGILAVTFAIKGPTSNAQVIVNPVSAVTPGVFRKIFDFTRGGNAPASPPPATAPEGDH